MADGEAVTADSADGVGGARAGVERRPRWRRQQLPGTVVSAAAAAAPDDVVTPVFVAAAVLAGAHCCLLATLSTPLCRLAAILWWAAS